MCIKRTCQIITLFKESHLFISHKITNQYWYHFNSITTSNNAYILTGLRAGRFTRPANKLHGVQIGLANIVVSFASKLEWGRNASIKTFVLASQFACHNCQQIGCYLIYLSTLLADWPISICLPMLLLDQFIQFFWYLNIS